MIAVQASSEGARNIRPLSDQQFATLRDFLYERSGLHFGANKKFLLESRVTKRMRSLGTQDVAGYVSLVTSARGTGELAELLDVVTTHETSFFRNRPQVEAFRNHVLPEVLRAQADTGHRTLRIWSAACSSGEEPYTLAILVLERLGADLDQWSVQILGTDIAASVIEQARRGVYGKYSFRFTPAYYTQKYFEIDGPDAYRLKDAPKRLVEFQIVNFADDARMRMLRGFQVIFCRNALIYFDREAKRRFVAHFARSLNPGGYLFVGHSESLHGISDAFKLIHFSGALAYKKPVAQSDRSLPSWNRIA